MNNLPIKLLKEIFEKPNLSTFDLVTCSMVNKKLLNLIKNFSFYKPLQFCKKNKIYPPEWMLCKIDDVKFKPEDFERIVLQIKRVEKEIPNLHANFRNSTEKTFGQELLKKYSVARPIYYKFPPEILQFVPNLEKFSLEYYLMTLGLTMTPKDILFLMKNFKFKSSIISNIVIRSHSPEVLDAVLSNWEGGIDCNLLKVLSIYYGKKRSCILFPIVVKYYDQERLNIRKDLLDIKFKDFREEYNFQKILFNEMYKRGVLDVYIDKCINYMSIKELENILNLDLKIEHSLIKIAKCIYHGESIYPEEINKSCVISDAIFQLCIKKKLSFEIIKKMIEHNLQRKLSYDQFNFIFRMLKKEGYRIFEKQETISLLQNNFDAFFKVPYEKIVDHCKHWSDQMYGLKIFLGSVSNRGNGNKELTEELGWLETISVDVEKFMRITGKKRPNSDEGIRGIPEKRFRACSKSSIG